MELPAGATLFVQDAPADGLTTCLVGLAGAGVIIGLHLDHFNAANLVLIVLIFITLLVTLFWPFSPSGINTFDPYCLGVAHAIAMPKIEMQAAAAGRLCGRPLL